MKELELLDLIIKLWPVISAMIVAAFGGLAWFIKLEMFFRYAIKHNEEAIILSKEAYEKEIARIWAVRKEDREAAQASRKETNDKLDSINASIIELTSRIPVTGG